MTNNSKAITKLNSKLVKLHVASGTIQNVPNIGYYTDVDLPSEVKFSQNVYGVTLSYINPSTGENVCDSSLGCIVLCDSRIRITAASTGYIGLTVKARILYVAE